MSALLSLDHPAQSRRGLAHGRPVVTIGKFDGVHRGHQSLINRARLIARQTASDRLVAVTFHPDPRVVLRPDLAPATLTTLEDRASLLRDAGVDDVLVLPFDRRTASWSATDFADRIIVDALHARAVVVGTDFRFGNRAVGSVATLSALGRHRHFLAVGVPLSGGQHAWSSTYIRTCLVEGDVTAAAQVLGRPFSLVGTVTDQPEVIAVPPSMATPAPGRYTARVRCGAVRRDPAVIDVLMNQVRTDAVAGAHPGATAEMALLERITDCRTRRRH